MPLAAVIVVGANSGRWLDACFRSLGASRYADRLIIMYVDNASTDGSVEAVREAFPQVEILRNETNVGFAAANNQAMRLALERGADYLLLINPDTRTPAGLIGELVNFLEAHPSYGIVGPMQCTYGSFEGGQPTPNGWTQQALENGERHAFYHWMPSLPSEAGPVEGRAPGTIEHAYVQGAALALRATVATQIGLLDPTYHSFYEEVDLCRRVRWAGYRVALLKDVWIEHAGGSEGAPSWYRAFHMTRNRFLCLFTDPSIRGAKLLRLTAHSIKHDITFQLPRECGLVVSWRQYLQVWASLAKLLPYIIHTRLRNKRLASARRLAGNH